MKNSKTKQIGIGLLEVTLSLAIIGLVLIVATRFYTSSSESRRIAEAHDQIGIIQNAAERWLLSHQDFSNMTYITSFKDFVNRDYLPLSYLNNPKNPWGGSITVTYYKASSYPSYMYVGFSGIPSSSALRLQSQYKSILCQAFSINPAFFTGDNPQIASLYFSFFESCPPAEK